MRRLYGRLRAFLERPPVRRAIQLGAVGLGLQALQAILKEHEQRIDTLEERGLVPIDDLVTIRDLEKVEGRIDDLEAVPPPGGPVE